MQNRYLKNIYSYEERQNLTVKDMHEQQNLEPINLRLHNRLKKVWNNLTQTNQEIAEKTEILTDNDMPSHLWWPRMGKEAEMEEPDPIFVYEDTRA